MLQPVRKVLIQEPLINLQQEVLLETKWNMENGETAHKKSQDSAPKSFLLQLLRHQGILGVTETQKLTFM